MPKIPVMEDTVVSVYLKTHDGQLSNRLNFIYQPAMAEAEIGYFHTVCSGIIYRMMVGKSQGRWRMDGGIPAKQPTQEAIVKNTRMFLMVAAITMAGAAQAAGPSRPQVEYSADSVMETAEVSMKGHVNYAPTRERREMVMDGGDKMITITRQDKKLAWTLMPAEKMYMEMSLAQAGAKNKADPSQYQIEQTVVGPETVNGVNTTKSKIIMTGPKGEKMGGFMWVTRENIVVKMDAIAIEKSQKLRFKTELTNLKVGKQDPKLFEVPAGYEKMSMGMPGIGAMMGDNKKKDDSDKKSAGGAQEKKGFGLMDAVKLLK